MLKAGDLYCSSYGAVVPEHPAKPPLAEVRGRLAGERKYLTDKYISACSCCALIPRLADLMNWKGAYPG